MAHNKEFAQLWNVLRSLLILSHGQAHVERGFSINKEVSNTNIQNTSLVARRQIKDHVKNVGGVENVIITKELLQSCKNSRQKYHFYLNEKKACAEKKARMTKRKEIEESVEIINQKRRALEKDVDLLLKDADEASVAAEEKKDFFLLTKANALRKRSIEKKDELKLCDEHLKEKKLLLRNL